MMEERGVYLPGPDPGDGWLVTVSRADGEVVFSHSLPADPEPDQVFDTVVGVAWTIREHGWEDGGPEADCHWQHHEASGDGNPVCPNCGSDFKRGRSAP